MWRFFRKIGSLFTSSVKSKQPPPVEDDLEFSLLAQPKTPEGLKNLQIEKMWQGSALLLRGFNVDLTLAQAASHDDPQFIAWASRSLHWAFQYHGLNTEWTMPVRLHSDNVLLINNWRLRRNGDEIEAFLRGWLDQFGWKVGQQFVVQELTTTTPLEDGFFRCLRILVREPFKQQVDDEQLPGWLARHNGPATIIDWLRQFILEEYHRIGDHLCEQFLEKCYKAFSHEQLLHPAFALVWYPTFDNGSIGLEFAGSVVPSSSELRFWSRPAYYHK